MRWYDALWIGPKAARHRRRIVSCIKEHKPIDDLVTKEVGDYIERHNLYK